MINVMVDIETFSTTPGGVIVSIGAVKFDDGLHPSFTDPLGACWHDHTFYRCIDIFSSLMAGLTIDPITVNWWKSQSNEAIGALNHGTVPLRQALEDLAAYLQGHDTIWAKGPDFDLVMLKAAYDAVGMRLPWHFRKARDVRTILALANIKHEKGKDAHNALADAKSQAVAVIHAAKVLGVKL